MNTIQHSLEIASAYKANNLSSSLSFIVSTSKVIAVCGATGQQGGSVVKYLLEDGGFKVRGLTRNADSPKAKGTKSFLNSPFYLRLTLSGAFLIELSAQGVEVVQADFDDIENVRKAFSGAYGVFGVTDCRRNVFVPLISTMPTLCYHNLYSLGKGSW